MKNRVLFLCSLISVLSLTVFVETLDPNEGVYDSFDSICSKCICSRVNSFEEVLSVDCSFKSINYVISEWPEQYKEIVYVMSFNKITKILPLPSTDAVLFFICKNCYISEIADSAFIDTKNIVALDLAHNEISSDSLNPDIFRGPPSNTSFFSINLKILDFSYNRITYLDGKLFEHTPLLQTLILSFNRLKEIADGTLEAIASCHNLEVLHLKNIELFSLPGEIFEKMSRLTEIDLSFNYLQEVPFSLTKTGPNLEVLNLDGNSIEHIKHENLDYFEQLEILNISSMPSLSIIEHGSFVNLKSLKVLNCKKNINLKEINLSDLVMLKKLKELDLSENSLETLFAEKTIESDAAKQNNFFQNLNILRLAKNPWKCDCSFIHSLYIFDHNSSYYNRAIKSDEARCAKPYDLFSMSIYTLPSEYVCIADQKFKPLKLSSYEPPQFLRPNSIFLTIGSIILVIGLGIVIGLSIVCITRRLKSRNEESNPIRYSVVHNPPA